MLLDKSTSRAGRGNQIAQALIRECGSSFPAGRKASLSWIQQPTFKAKLHTLVSEVKPSMYVPMGRPCSRACSLDYRTHHAAVPNQLKSDAHMVAVQSSQDCTSASMKLQSPGFHDSSQPILHQLSTVAPSYSSIATLPAPPSSREQRHRNMQITVPPDCCTMKV